jgi:hypothetical protein
MGHSLAGAGRKSSNRLKDNSMKPTTFGRLTLALAALTLACGCTDGSTSALPTSPTTTTTTTTNPATVTETYTGSLTTNGAASFPFTAQAGIITATLTTLGDTTVMVGLAMGTWTGSACAIAIANDAALQGAVVTGTTSAATNVCVRIYDVGYVTTPQAYTITVTHP